MDLLQKSQASVPCSLRCMCLTEMEPWVISLWDLIIWKITSKVTLTLVPPQVDTQTGLPKGDSPWTAKSISSQRTMTQITSTEVIKALINVCGMLAPLKLQMVQP